MALLRVFGPSRIRMLESAVAAEALAAGGLATGIRLSGAAAGVAAVSGMVQNTIAGVAQAMATATGALPAQAESVVSLTLTSAPGGALLPWSFGHAFKEGDVPAGQYLTSTTDTIQAAVRNTWPDGSVKFAVISGRSTLSAATPKAVSLSRTFNAPGGANVAEPASLDASVTFTGAVTGTYTLQSCLGIDRSTWSLGSPGRVRQFLGPVMSEFHYYRPTSDAHVTVWFYVRRYAGGETEVETVVENGWNNVASPGQRDYTVTVNVGGTDRYGPAALSHLHHTRWSRVDWIGTDPQVYPQHDVAYIKATKLVPNYVTGTPQESAFTESVIENPAPFDQGSFPASMGSAGFTESIAVMPLWAARYYTNGDKRGYQSTVGHMRRYGRYGVHYRDETTGRPIVANDTRFINSANSGISFLGNQTPTTPAPTGAAPPTWASSHHPMGGYDAYLLTGRWSAAEEMEFIATIPRKSINAAGSFSSARRFGWCMRSLAACAALSPVAANRTAAAASLAYYCNFEHDYWNIPANVLGGIDIINNEQFTGDGLWRDYAPWMVGYAVTSLAWASEIGVGLAGTDLTKFNALRDLGHKLYIGLAGDDTGFPYPQMSNAYSIPFGEGQTNQEPTTWFNFAQVYANMVSRGQADGGYTGALGQNFGGAIPVAAAGMVEYSELHGIAAVAFAKDHGVAGASASWARIASAPNIINNTQAFLNRPIFSIRPRNNVPAWADIPVGTVAPIGGTNTPDNVQSTLTSYSGLGNPVNLIRAWCGGCLATINGKQYLVIHGGGHGDYGGNEVLKFGPLDSNTPTWSVVALPTPDAQVIPEAAYNADGKPNVSHTRSLLAALNGRMYRFGQPGVWIQATGYNTTDSIDLGSGVWAPAGTHANSSFGSGIRGSANADAGRNLLWYVGDQNARLFQYNPATNTWTQYAPTVATGNTLHSAISPARDEICAIFSPTTMLYSLSNPSAAPVTTGFTGAVPSGDSGLVWDEGRSMYVSLPTSGARNVLRELEPISKVWATRTFTGTYETTPDDSNGIFGRFQYVSALKGYLYIGRTSGAVYFYRSHA